RVLARLRAALKGARGAVADYRSIGATSQPRNSRALPLLPGEACLSQDHRQKTQTDGSPVRIRYREHPLAPHHELVLASRVGALESETSQGGNELAAADRSPRGHQLAFLTSTLMPPSGGTRSPLATRTRTHSSTTSASWSRQASSVGPVAITPGSPGTVAQNTPPSTCLYRARRSALSR